MAFFHVVEIKIVSYFRSKDKIIKKLFSFNFESISVRKAQVNKFGITINIYNICGT